MLSLALLLALHAPPVDGWPEQECRSAYGKTACGYNCVAAYGDVRCAAHPQGTCRAAYGKIVCGFGCAADYGQVKCAQTPGGVCHAAYGQVVCSEPSRMTGGAGRGGRPLRGVPQQECKSAYGVTACGYGCAAEYGQVKCAQTPGGMCQAAYGQVVCGEPSPVTVPAGGAGRWPSHDVPQQECKSAYGTTVCGYGCAAAYGQVKCARTPGGVCQAAYGQVVCSEPGWVTGGDGSGWAGSDRVGLPQLECKSAYGMTLCGYGCAADYGQLRCAQTPGAVCQAAYGQVVCSDD